MDWDSQAPECVETDQWHCAADFNAVDDMHIQMQTEFIVTDLVLLRRFRQCRCDGKSMRK
eukprot:9456196-Pyramimonas_sp.AAC.1